MPTVAPDMPQSAGTDVPSPSAEGSPPPTLTLGAVGDPRLQAKLEKWQSDHLLYTFALRATQAREQLCALDQAPDSLCRPSRSAAAAIEPEPAQPAYRPFIQPAPPPDPTPPYRVVSVAGAGSDLVVTFRNTDLNEVRAVRPGGWLDQDFTLVSADYTMAVIKNRKRSYRLPVTASGTWGGGS